MDTRKLPPQYQNVMITYIATVRVNHWSDRRVPKKVTRRAFYCESKGYYNSKDEWISTPNGYFSVPCNWQMYKGNLLPHGFNTYGRINPNHVTKWEFDK